MDQPRAEIRWLLKPNETFRIRFSVLEPDEGRVLAVTSEIKEGVQHWAEFLMWDYMKMTEMRKKATKYHTESRSFYVDQDLLNELKLKNLLRSWSFGEVDPNMRLSHFNGVLVDESWKLIQGLYPCIANALIERMNEVLEGYA